MACHPPHPDSIIALQRLSQEVAARGDECLSMLLQGIDLYVSMGREWELLESMRTFAHDSQEMVNGTPSVADLQDLYGKGDEDR